MPKQKIKKISKKEILSLNDSSILKHSLVSESLNLYARIKNRLLTPICRSMPSFIIPTYISHEYIVFNYKNMIAICEKYDRDNMSQTTLDIFNELAI